MENKLDKQKSLISYGVRIKLLSGFFAVLLLTLLVGEWVTMAFIRLTKKQKI